MPQPAASEDVKELSKEEIAKRKQEVSNFYKENIKHLKIQKEYESLLTEIEELRAKRLQAQMFQAQTYQGMDYGRITPLLVKAIQEQQEQIETLKTEVKELKDNG